VDEGEMLRFEARQERGRARDQRERAASEAVQRGREMRTSNLVHTMKTSVATLAAAGLVNSQGVCAERTHELRRAEVRDPRSGRSAATPTAIEILRSVWAPATVGLVELVNGNLDHRKLHSAAVTADDLLALFLAKAGVDGDAAAAAARTAHTAAMMGKKRLQAVSGALSCSDEAVAVGLQRDADQKVRELLLEDEGNVKCIDERLKGHVSVSMLISGVLRAATSRGSRKALA